MSIWLNVDKPTKKCTLHTDDCCSWVAKQTETPLKGWGRLKQDGGWLPFDDLTQAKEYCRSEYPNYKVGRCNGF